MITVHVKNNDIQGALRELKRKVKKAGILEEIQDRRYFVSKSQRKREKKSKRR